MTQSADTIEHLLARLKRGDKLALSGIYDLLRQPLYGYLRRMGASRQDADDILQSVFTRVWQYRSSYVDQPEAQRGQAWLFRITRNAMNDFYKQTPRMMLCEFDTELTDDTPGPDEQLQNAQLQQQLTAALDALPQQTREAIVLSRFSSLSTRDIALLMNISENNVKVRIHRGLTTLKEVLNVNEQQ